MTHAIDLDQAYARLMRELPDPARRMTLTQIATDTATVRDILAKGGVVLVCDDRDDAFIGVLTRDPEILGDATLAQAIQAGQIPPLSELLSQ